MFSLGFTVWLKYPQLFARCCCLLCMVGIGAGISSVLVSDCCLPRVGCAHVDKLFPFSSFPLPFLSPFFLLASGKGWYDYDKGSRKPRPSPEVAALIKAHREEIGRYGNASYTPRVALDVGVFMSLPSRCLFFFQASFVVCAPSFIRGYLQIACIVFVLGRSVSTV